MINLTAIAGTKAFKLGIALVAIIAVSSTVKSCSNNRAELLGQIERLTTEKVTMQAILNEEKNALSALEKALKTAKQNHAASSAATTELEKKFQAARAEAERQKKLFADYKALQSTANADMVSVQEQSNIVLKERQDELANLFNSP